MRPAQAWQSPANKPVVKHIPDLLRHMARIAAAERGVQPHPIVSVEQWALADENRTRALLMVACVIAEQAGYTADSLRAWASTVDRQIKPRPARKGLNSLPGERGHGDVG